MLSVKHLKCCRKMNVVLWILFLVQFLCQFGSTRSQAPCARYFRYIQDEITHEIQGHVQIPSPPVDVPLEIKVALSIATALPSNYVGRLELAESKPKTVQAIREGRPLNYRIIFPLRNPVPVMTNILFNHRQLCVGPKAVGPVVTSIVLEHTLYPPGTLSVSHKLDDDDEEKHPSPMPTDTTSMPTDTTSMPTHTFSLPTGIFSMPTDPTLMEKVSTDEDIQPEWDPEDIRTRLGSDNSESLPDSTSKVSALPIPTGIPAAATALKFLQNVDDFQFDNECGINGNGGLNTLIAADQKTVLPGQWPWLVAIFMTKEKFEFQCAGVLITDRHVLTAAHCLMRPDDVKTPTNMLSVSVGRYRLHDWNEEGASNHEVHNYTIHPDYRNNLSADADIAILTLSNAVQFGDLVRPICLWAGSVETESVVGKVGQIVGWGKNVYGKPYKEEPRVAKAPIVSHADCLWSNPGFVSFTSNRTFCAGERDGSGPCNGDSGSGFIIYDKTLRRYELRGIVSRSLVDRTTLSCNLKEFVVYVDIAKYLEWIRATIRS